MFSLRQARIRPIQQLSFLLCLLSILAFIFFQWRMTRLDVFQSFSILIVIVSMFFDQQWHNKYLPVTTPPVGFRPVNRESVGEHPGPTVSKMKPLPFSLSLLVTGICWMGMPLLSWLSLAFFLICLLEYQARQPVQIILGAEIIIAQGFLKRSYPWHRFSNIVLKDGLLTLDFKNNRIIQKEITDNNHQGEDLFNRYCQIKISGAAL